jgi:RAP1 GTPase activating protein 1
LDTISDCTGEYSIYENFDNTEIMFHVSTLLPHSTKNNQQLERKRHIGNDRVAIVFQEENTPFSPTMINSKLIQVYLIIQPVKTQAKENDPLKRYKLSIVSRNGAPYFGPYLYKPYVFLKNDNLKKFLYAKLINAEYASLKLFHSFNEQIIKPQLQRLCDKLFDLTQKFNSFKPNESLSPSLSLKQRQIQKKSQVRSPVKRITSKFGFLQSRSNTLEEVMVNIK